MNLLTKEELFLQFQFDKKQLKFYLKEGIPHLKLGKELRFIEEEITIWLSTFKTEQERLEESFIDGKGRKLCEYVLSDAVLSFFKIKKAKLNGLCTKGMPFVQIGEKRFFHLNDIVEFFHCGDQVTIQSNDEAENKTKYDSINSSLLTTSVLSPSAENEKNIFVVDGSYDEFSNFYGVGVVMKTNNTTKGFSFGGICPGKSNIICEYFAITHALELIKSENIQKATIYTDQLSFVTSSKQSFYRYPWMNRAENRLHIDHLESLFNELKGKVTFKYVAELENKHKNILYENAHVLSRKYTETIVDDDLTVQKLKDTKASTPIIQNSILNVSSNVPNQIDVIYNRAGQNFLYFNLIKDGKIRPTKMCCNTSLHGALLLAKSHVETSKCRLKVIIHELPNFEKDLKYIFYHCKKPKLINQIRELFHFLNEHSDLEMKNSLLSYFPKENNEASIA